MEMPTYKVITLGSYGVGKTCLLLRACNTESKLPEKYQCTIGVDFKTKVHSLQNQKYKFAIWDTAGQERFQTINRLYYKETDAVFLVFDLTDRASFDRINSLIEDFQNYSEGSGTYVLIGNKIDKENKQIELFEIQKLANSMKIPYIQCSAYTGENIDQIFDILISELRKKGVIKKNTQSFIIKTEDIKKKSKCC